MMKLHKMLLTHNKKENIEIASKDSLMHKFYCIRKFDMISFPLYTICKCHFLM